MAELKKREKVLMAVAAAVLVYFVVNQFVCSKSQPAQAQDDQKQTAAATTSEAPKSTVEKKPAAIRKRMGERRVEFAAWGRDPFSESYRLAKADTTQSDSSALVMRGVIWKGSEAYVLIGDNVMKEGDQIGDLKVLDIDKNRVVCKKKGKIITLILRDDNE